VSCASGAAPGPAATAPWIDIFFKGTRIVQLTTKDLGKASKVDNINGLLHLANREGRVDTITGMQLVDRFQALPSGDLLLLQCLKSPACDPSLCADVASRSDLHREVALRRPDFNLAQANQAAGAITEMVMIRFFEASGWTKVDGQVGRTGIDGLFVKRNTDGPVREVLIVESKYNTGVLQPTNHGPQMSWDWAKRKLAELILQNPNDPTYPQIAFLIENRDYRARLWNMKIEDGRLRINLQRVHSKGGDVDIEDGPSDGIPNPPPKIDVGAPQGSFEKTLVEEYKRALEKLAPP